MKISLTISPLAFLTLMLLCTNVGVSGNEEHESTFTSSPVLPEQQLSLTTTEADAKEGVHFERHDNPFGDNRELKGKKGKKGEKSYKNKGKGKKEKNTSYQGGDDWYNHGKGKGKHKKGGKKSKGHHHKGKKGSKQQSPWPGWYYIDDNFYIVDDFNNHHPSKGRPSRPSNPTPTFPPTVSQSTLPNGTIYCSSNDSSTPNYKFNDSLEEKIVNYEYSLKTVDGYDSEIVVQNIEIALFDLMIDFLGCERGSSRRPLRRDLQVTEGGGISRTLAVVGIHPDPDDKITEKLGGCVNCHKVQGGVTIFTDDNDSKEKICELITKIKGEVSKWKSGEIGGVDNIDLTNIAADGVSCGNYVAPVTSVETSRSNTDAAVWHAMLWPLILLALLLAFFTHRRRQRRLRELNDIEDRVTTYIDDMRPDPVPTIDVHACNSAACTCCMEGKEETYFIPTKGPNLLQSEVESSYESNNEDNLQRNIQESHQDTHTEI